VLAGVIAYAENKRLADRFDLVARDASGVRLSYVELDGFDKFRKGVGLQDDVAFGIGDQAGSVKDYSVIAADKIHKNDRLLLQLRPVCDHIASQLDLPLVER